MPIALLLAVFLVFAGAGVAGAKVYLTQPQAVALAFPKAKPRRKVLFLTDAQAAKIQALCGVKPDSRIVVYYEGPEGAAFFDRRMVRTLPVVYMAVVKPDGTLGRVDVMSWEEPDDYFPPPRWLALYTNRKLGNDLRLGNGIPHITGASLTSQAMNDGLRLILATYQAAVLAAK